MPYHERESEQAPRKARLNLICVNYEYESESAITERLLLLGFLSGAVMTLFAYGDGVERDQATHSLLRIICDRDFCR